MKSDEMVGKPKILTIDSANSSSYRNFTMMTLALGHSVMIPQLSRSKGLVVYLLTMTAATFPSSELGAAVAAGGTIWGPCLATSLHACETGDYKLQYLFHSY